MLTPTLRRGQIVIMDNLRAGKVAGVRASDVANKLADAAAEMTAWEGMVTEQVRGPIASRPLSSHGQDKLGTVQGWRDVRRR